jgi:hypothetical protein
MRRILIVTTSALFLSVIVIADLALAQSGRKKIRLSLSSTNVALLPTFAAYDKAFFATKGLTSS